MFVSRIMAVAAAVAAIAPAAVYAAPAPEGTARQANVKFADLNLASAAGRHTLQSRVNTAVSQVCDLNEIPDNFENARCRQVAITGAKQQIADAIARTSTQFAEAKPAQAPANTASGS